MHSQPRTDVILNIVIHDNEGPEGDHAAQSLADYLQTIDAGYHAVADNVETITTATDNQEVWGNGAINGRSLDICLIHYAKDEWTDAYSVAEMDQAAQWVAAKCVQHGIPIVWLSSQQLQTRTPGLCTHGDLTAAGYAGTEGHTDPGPNFPRTFFIDKVAKYADPVVCQLPNPQGGVWFLRKSGRVDFASPAGVDIVGGMISPADRSHFAGRTAEKLTLRWYRPARRAFRRTAGYVITATSGETYIPQGQH